MSLNSKTSASDTRTFVVLLSVNVSVNVSSYVLANDFHLKCEVSPPYKGQSCDSHKEIDTGFLLPASGRRLQKPTWRA